MNRKILYNVHDNRKRIQKSRDGQAEIINGPRHSVVVIVEKVKNNPSSQSVAEDKVS